VTFFGTGGGAYSGPAQDGEIAGNKPVPLRWPVQATIGGVAANVEYAGTSPGSTNGLFQVNLRVPDGVQAGVQPVTVVIHGAASLPGPTLRVR